MHRAAAGRRQRQLEVMLAIHVDEGITPDLLNMAAGLRRAMGETALAWRACLQSLELDRGLRSNRAAWTCKGALLREGGALEDAINVLEPLHAELPGDTFVLRALIRAYAEFGQHLDDDAARNRALELAEKLAALSEPEASPRTELRELQARATTATETAGLLRLIEWLQELAQDATKVP